MARRILSKIQCKDASMDHHQHHCKYCRSGLHDVRSSLPPPPCTYRSWPGRPQTWPRTRCKYQTPRSSRLQFRKCSPHGTHRNSHRFGSTRNPLHTAIRPACCDYTRPKDHAERTAQAGANHSNVDAASGNQDMQHILASYSHMTCTPTIPCLPHKATRTPHILPLLFHCTQYRMAHPCLSEAAPNHV